MWLRPAQTRIKAVSYAFSQIVPLFYEPKSFQDLDVYWFLQSFVNILSPTLHEFIYFFKTHFLSNYQLRRKSRSSWTPVILFKIMAPLSRKFYFNASVVMFMFKNKSNVHFCTQIIIEYTLPIQAAQPPSLTLIYKDVSITSSYNGALFRAFGWYRFYEVFKDMFLS